MYRRILVAVDGSAPSLLALKHAIGLARDGRARLRVLNVIDELAVTSMLVNAYAATDLGDIRDSMHAEGRRTLDRAAKLAAKRGVKAQTTLIESGARAVCDVILAEARRSGADLIVMGTHGRRGFNRLLLGSDAECVLRESPAPLLLTRGAGASRGRSKRGAQ